MDVNSKHKPSTTSRFLPFTLVAAILLALPAASQVQIQPLQLTISIAQPQISEPFPARITLHFHNAGSRPLWLYKPLHDAGGANGRPEGPTLAAHLETAAPENTRQNTQPAGGPAVGSVLEAAGFPHPALIQLAPGGAFSQTAVIHINPATRQAANGTEPVWGAYQLSVVYSARYSNGDSINKNLGVDVWEGYIPSNTIRVTLAAAAPDARGVVRGGVVDRDSRPSAGVLVSLSDWSEHRIAQIITGNDGGFSFSDLPPGRYWVTVRRPGAIENQSFFEHADLTDSQPEATLHLIMLNQEIYEARQMMRKPVLFKITDSGGTPITDAELHILWSSGTVLDNVKTKLPESGLAVVNLIPGSNYVTIVKRHCQKEDRMADVAPGDGIDGFSFTFDCKR
ncbi:MAG TPA: carboxypeptidase-like regulatory domain-containing protein [Terriglobia bacterium]|nr:carboxypeptidase-like regulatory domain-containing protein [Terriglobia bacterium]